MHYSTITINSNECIGTSLSTINYDFSLFDTLIYSLSSIVASNSNTTVNVSEPAIGLGIQGPSNANAGYYTQNAHYKWGHFNSGAYQSEISRSRFLDNYLLEHSSVTITKVFEAVDNTFILLSDGSFWGMGSANYWQNIYIASGPRSEDILLQLNIMFSNKSVSDFDVSGDGNGWVDICVLCTDNSCYAWGYNAWGENGSGSTVSVNHPVAVSIAGKTISQVSVGGGAASNGANIMLLMTDGTVYAAGYNGLGQLGVGDTVDKHVFTQCKQDAVTYLTGVASLQKTGCYAMGWTRYVIKSDGTVWGAGWNGSSNLGTGSYTNSSYFIRVGTLTNIKKIVTAGFGSVTTIAALDTSGNVYTWGYSGYGATGSGVVANLKVPTNITTYRQTPTTTASLPNINDIIGADTPNVGAIGLISVDNKLFLAGSYVFTSPSLFTNDSPHTTIYYQFEKAPVHNVVEASFYTNTEQSIGVIVRDINGIVWVWGLNEGGIVSSDYIDGWQHIPVAKNFY